MVTVSPGLTSTVVPVSEPSVPIVRSMLPGTLSKPPPGCAGGTTTPGGISDGGSSVPGWPLAPIASVPFTGSPLRSVEVASPTIAEPSAIVEPGGSWVV